MYYFRTYLSIIWIFLSFNNSFSSITTEIVEHENSTIDNPINNTLERYKRGLNIDNIPNAILLTVAALLCSVPDDTPKKKQKKACQINVKNLKINHALIINPKDHSKFLYPDELGNIYFDEDEPVFLSCGTNGNTFEQIPSVPYETFYCLCDQRFYIGNFALDFDKLTCAIYPEHNIKYEKDDGEYHKYKIGFKVDDDPNNFLNLIDVYYLKKFKATVYVRSVISKSLAGGQDTSVGNAYYQKSCCIRRPTTLSSFFGETAQEKTFEALLFSQTLAKPEDRYLRRCTDFVLNRCYLTPKQSMVYSAAALATYSDFNVAPQWKIISKHNWLCIENHISEMAKLLKTDLIVYTGVYDGLRLVDEYDEGRLKDIYLHAHRKRDNTIRRVPISLYHFKIVLDPLSGKAAAFVTVNNPYIIPGPDYEICNPITMGDNMMVPDNWDPTNPRFGYSYMCSVNDFLDKVSILFEDYSLISTTGLLYVSLVASSSATTTVTTTTAATTTNKNMHLKDEIKRSVNN